MKKPAQLTSAFIASILFSTITHATTLNQVFQQAVKSDPTYQKAQADWMAAKQSLNLARAGYLPAIVVTGNYGHSSNSKYSPGGPDTWQPTGPSANTLVQHPAGSTHADITSHSYSITATQPIFNIAAWSTITQASNTVKAATASYLAASQDLIQRTSNAYFTVLQDYEALRFNEASQNALYQTLLTNKEQFRVGLIAITDVYNAQSTFDTTKAKQFALKAKLNIDLENLRAITGKRYTTLNGIRNQLPLATPAPSNINAWVNIAIKQSYALQAKTYAMLAAKSAITAANGAFLPAINAQIGYTGGNTTGFKTDDNSTTYGVNLSYTPFAGGANFANSKQARYKYLSASADQQAMYRSVVSGTRQAYLGISSGIQTIQADQKAIESAKLSLEATRAGYKVGTRTMVNVLDDTTTLYQQKQSYADDQYTYLNNIVSLKEAAGTLSDKDVQKISRWLSQPVNLLRTKIITPKKKKRRSKSKTIKPTKPTNKKTGPLKKNTNTTKATQKPTNQPTRADKQQGRYTLQLFASKNIKVAQHFKTQLAANQKVKIRYDKPWFKVTFGQYQSHQSAKQAIAKLSSKLNKQNIWIYKIK